MKSDRLLGIDFSIHLLTPTLAQANTSGKVGPSAAAILEKYFRSVFAGAITTAVAFFALMFSDFKGLKELGFIAGVGVLSILVAVILFMLLVIPHVRFKKRSVSAISQGWSGLHSVLVKTPYVVVAAGVLLLLIPT